MDGMHMTRRNRILKALSLILPAGALGASVALALTCSDAMAAQDKTSAPDQTSQENIATRLHIIRTGVSSIAGSGTADIETRADARFTPVWWGNGGFGRWHLGWGNGGWGNGGWHNWHNGWNNGWHNGGWGNGGWHNFWHNW
jgi:rSAM-associated Gly-rich repeat protein